MRKTLWIPTMLAAAAVVGSIATLRSHAQPADTATPPPNTAPIMGANAAGAAPATAPTTQEALGQFSYSIGYNIAKTLKEQDVQVDVTALNAGLTDAAGGQPSKFTDAQAEAAMQAVQEFALNNLVTKNKTEGSTFLAKNKTAEGVKTTASGLQYKITTEGAGAQPKSTDTVKVHYTGKLLNGTTFDSSVERGEPIEIPLDSVIPGWSEGVQLFKVGSKGTLWIPSELAYGDTPRPGSRIPPGATLVFDIQVLEIVPPATQPTMGGAGGRLPTTLPDMNSMPEPMP